MVGPFCRLSYTLLATDGLTPPAGVLGAVVVSYAFHVWNLDTVALTTLYTKTWYANEARPSWKQMFIAIA